MILKDKVVVVTGVGPGMGQALCRGAAAEGAKVVISARSTDVIDALRSEISAGGGEAIAVPTDVTDTDQCRRLADEAVRAFGRIDGLVHSAYYHPDWAPLERCDIGQVSRALDVIAVGGLRIAQAVIPLMKRQGGGSIVNVSTMATRRPFPGEGGYAMGKAALGQLTRQLAVELAGTGIRVNTALMGWMDGVPLQSYFAAQEDGGAALRAETAARIPVGRIPPDRDCAKSVFFLLSDHASEISGASLDVNGGDWVAP
ncbi:SDR family oxidoreductase [Azospirillum sp. INR13]|uniref:SDR family oxidoreductase n=1 Tax=Azospirillum sp. INR13 TaxID=2596919 RepID=UPI0018921F35|nr:SDR family oxidoreductase [Azospirillum sp. INR13]MBF5094957.1 SDR family oxidoreductase [Azospirillum sp. INR13]